VGITGLYYFIVATNNCVDTDTNRRAVAAVLSMRQTINHPGVDWHAITSGFWYICRSGRCNRDAHFCIGLSPIPGPLRCHLYSPKKRLSLAADQFTESGQPA
jgi:hypothetical protein